MIPNAVKRRVRVRAGHRCEYCRMRQDTEPDGTYEVEHIIARSHGGTDDATNLAPACPSCNSHKGPNLAGLDPETGLLEALFHPRRQAWEEHFVRVDDDIVGLTPTGRTTIRVLDMNSEIRRQMRQSQVEDS